MVGMDAYKIQRKKIWKYAHTMYQPCADCKQPHAKNRIEKHLLQFCFRKFFSTDSVDWAVDNHSMLRNLKVKWEVLGN